MKILIRYPSGQKQHTDGEFKGYGIVDGCWLVIIESNEQRDEEGRPVLIAVDPRAMVLTEQGVLLYDPYEVCDEMGYPEEMRKLLKNNKEWAAIRSAILGKHSGEA